MSEPQTPAGDDKTEQDDSPAKPESDTEVHRSDADQSTDERALKVAGRGLAMAALLVALGALALTAWLWSEKIVQGFGESDQPVLDGLVTRLEALEQLLSRQDESLQQMMARISDQRLDERIDARLDADLEAGLAVGLDSRFEPIEQQMGALASALDDHRDHVNEVQSDLSGLQRLVTPMEQRLDDLTGRIDQATGVQRQVDLELALRLDLLEAAALLRFGQSQAELAGDHASAAAAFRRAQSLLQANDDPRLRLTQQRLSAELNALESSDGPDWAQAQVRLAKMADQIDSWPQVGSGSESSSPDLPADSGDEGWWAGVSRSLGRLVEVERRDPLALDAGQVEALREQLQLRLVAAELAIERQDMDAVRRHLQRVDEQIERHFELSHPAVTAARDALETIQSLEPVQPPAELGRALASLIQVLEEL